MGDKIVEMIDGVIDQFRTPQDIYDKPTTMFVAEFAGSPPMNALKGHDSLHPGTTALRLDHAEVAVPAMREAFEGDVVFGVRTEHVRLSGPAPYRGRVQAVEYLGTTLTTPAGYVKAGVSSKQPVGTGEQVGARLQRRHRDALRPAGRPQSAGHWRASRTSF